MIISQTFTNLYYYWVKDKIKPDVEGRTQKP